MTKLFTVLLVSIACFAQAQETATPKTTYAFDIVRPDSIFLMETTYKMVSGNPRPESTTKAILFKSEKDVLEAVKRIRDNADNQNKEAAEWDTMTPEKAAAKAKEARDQAVSIEDIANRIEQELAKAKAVQKQ